MEVENDTLHSEENGMVLGGENSPSNSGMSGKKRKRKEILTPVIAERPTRERKSVDRFVASAEKETKEFKFEKGSGTTLKDIPNVVYKLSKRKGTDEVVQLLHKILYGKQAKSHVVKSNILQFSGYVWHENEEKEKNRIKEKLEKCRKEILVQISELVDLNLFKSTKKEDAVLKLFKFLESPHKTTDKLLEEKIKESKIKRMKKKLAKTKKKNKALQKRKSQDNKTSSDKENSDEEEDDHSSSDHEGDVEDAASEDNSDDDDYKEVEVSKGGPGSAKKPTRKLRKTETEDKPDAMANRKKAVRKAANQVAKESSEPSDDELQTVIRELLQEADFTKVTLADLLRQLGKRFNIDVSRNKAHLRSLIQAEIASMAESGNDDGEHEDDEDGKKNGESEDVINDRNGVDGNHDEGNNENSNGECEDGNNHVEGQECNNDVKVQVGNDENGNDHEGDDENVDEGEDMAKNVRENEDGGSRCESDATENVSDAVEKIAESKNILNEGEEDIKTEHL